VSQAVVGDAEAAETLPPLARNHFGSSWSMMKAISARFNSARFSGRWIPNGRGVSGHAGDRVFRRAGARSFVSTLPEVSQVMSATSEFQSDWLFGRLGSRMRCDRPAKSSGSDDEEAQQRRMG
jgi:hypothetical protein